MHWPYTIDYFGGFMAAQVGAAVLLTAALMFWRMPRWVRASLVVGAWVAVLSFALPPSFAKVGITLPAATFRTLLFLSVTLATAASVVARRKRVAVVAALAQIPLWWLSGFLTQSDAELAALHLAWIGAIAGVLARKTDVPLGSGDDREAGWSVDVRLHDALVFAAGLLAGLAMCLLVLHRQDSTADEQGYTFQAAVFAKGHLTSQKPPCWFYLESYYVFGIGDRLFSQYTPGWPMFLVPFFWMRAIWLASPVTMGLLGWGMARLGRSAMRALDAPPRTVRIAGTWAALLAILGASLITNAGTRYPHIYTLALYAWCLEACLQMGTPGLTFRRQVLWGLLLGTAALQMLSARPADGAFMGTGIFYLFARARLQGRTGLPAVLATVGASVFWGIVTLVILRVQLGEWFTTGYSLNLKLRYWNIVKLNGPDPDQWKYGLPLATGALCWWPASMPIGLAGLARMRARARELAWAMVPSCVAMAVFNEFLDLGQRGVDWGYGPRYHMVFVVPMAVGAAVVLAPMTVAALARDADGRPALARGGPFALAVLAVVVAWMRIVPSEWATVFQHVTQHAALTRAIEEAHLHDAVVLATDGTTGFNALDLPTNLPIDLYPDQDVLIAVERKDREGAEKCLGEAYPTRTLYHASGVSPVVITK